MQEVILKFNKEIERKLKRGIEKDDYYEIWKQLNLLKELKERILLCRMKKC